MVVIVEMAPEGVERVLIGNKVDSEELRQVGVEQGKKLAKEYGMEFFETSAFTNNNIKEAFTKLTELVLKANKQELEGLRLSSSEEVSLSGDEEVKKEKKEHQQEKQRPCSC